MKKNHIVIILMIVSALLILLGLFFVIKNKKLAENNIKIIDATYKCDNNLEPFYEDDKYIYSFLCTQSTSTYVKYDKNNKILVTKALNEGMFTIDELIKAGLKVHKEEK